MYFIFGSCRVRNVSLPGYTRKSMSIHSHYFDETLQYISWLKNESTINEKCFRDEKMLEEWEELVENWEKSDTVIVEISSIKYSKVKSYYFNLLIGKECKKNTIDELNCKLQTLKTVMGDKKLIFIPHANLYDEKITGYNLNRTILQMVSKYANEQLNIKTLDPMSIISKYGSIKCTTDINHYTDFMILMITRKILQF